MADRWIYSYGRDPRGRSYKMRPLPREVLEDKRVQWIERIVREHQLEQLRRLGFPRRAS